MLATDPATFARSVLLSFWGEVDSSIPVVRNRAVALGKGKAKPAECSRRSLPTIQPQVAPLFRANKSFSLGALKGSGRLF